MKGNLNSCYCQFKTNRLYHLFEWMIDVYSENTVSHVCYDQISIGRDVLDRKKYFVRSSSATYIKLN